MRRVVIMLVAAVAGTGCATQTVVVDRPVVTSVPGNRTFSAHGVTFQYPGGWIPFDLGAPTTTSPTVPEESPAPLADSLDIGVVGIDDLNNVRVTARPSIAPGTDFASWSRTEETSLANEFASKDIHVVSGPDPVTVAGVQAIRYRVVEQSGVGYVLHTTFVVFPDGAAQVSIECTSTPDRLGEVQAGCDLVLSSFSVR